MRDFPLRGADLLWPTPRAPRMSSRRTTMRASDPHPVVTPGRDGDSHPRWRPWYLVGAGILAPLLAVLVTGCGEAPPAAHDKTVEVFVTTPVRGKVADYQDFTGRLDG